MEKRYKTERNTAVDILADVEDFLLTLNKIKEDNPELRYTYSININPLQNPKRWEAELTLDKHEQEN
jgi:hypothetical protein|tara:strand:- start:22503 stop:22703 length:201 start_codon:yes stop_codon:yes gene_type:complete